MSPEAVTRLRFLQVGSATSTTIDFGAIFPFTDVPACNLPVYASQTVTGHHARLGTRRRWLGFVAIAISGD
ncbi:hypothetical protein BN2476_270037 [Paraburkholderia piptadeniae]|uniref:Uncharacterized protein n=1 Tax=Paraburkholderia piptadeniae TaxID=1701573 RepID=A0A1N7S1F6_9BURK|nr:hypothetical protein BN2476_270037 [Paraburkholderia piptadeniae]